MEAICNLWNRRWTTELLSRLLIVLTAVLLLSMPITEYCCDWDKFLRGGPDVEFSVLAWLLFAAMLVLTVNGTILRPRWMTASARRTLADERGIALLAAFKTSGSALSASRVTAALQTFDEAIADCLSSPPLRI